MAYEEAGSGEPVLLVHGRLEVITETAHLPNMERPDEFSRVLLDFLAVAPAQ